MAGGVSGARLWDEAVGYRTPEADRQVAQEDCPRRRDQDFLSCFWRTCAGGSSLSHGPPASPAPTHSKSPKILQASSPVAFVPLSTSRIWLPGKGCAEPFAVRDMVLEAGGREELGATVAGGEKPQMPPACWLRFSLDDFLPSRCREPSWRATGPLGRQAGHVPAGAGNRSRGLRLRWW